MIGWILSAQLLLSSAAVEPNRAIFRQDAVATANVVLLGDLADLDPLPAELRQPAKRIIVATFRADDDAIQLRLRTIKERARGRLPAIGPYLGGDDDTVLTVRRTVNRSSAPQPSARACARVVRAVSAGVSVFKHDFEPAACPPATPAGAVRYDRLSRSLSARRSLEPGDVIDVSPRGVPAGIRAGETLYLTTQVGPVLLQREATALRDAAVGAKVFVRNADGVIAAAPFAEARK